MLAKKILSAFSTDSGLNFNLFEILIENSYSIKNDILDLNEQDLNLLFKLLIDVKRPLAISKLINLLEINKSDYNVAVATLGLLKLNILGDLESLRKHTHLLENLTKKNAFYLQPYFDVFPEKHQQIIEASIALKRQKLEVFKEDLKDQIEFLKTEQLLLKAVEIEKKLKFHFPEITKSFVSAQQLKNQSKELNYAQIIERNISFEARAKSRKKYSSKFQSTLKSGAEDSLKLANLWYSELKNSNPELLLTQLEFIDFDDSEFYSKVLKETKLDIWTKIFLYIKSKNYLEGLQFLETHEKKLLTESPDSIYSYYYTKGVMFLGAGMQKEAEEIFTLIKEQKGDFRDVQLLLKNVK